MYVRVRLLGRESSTGGYLGWLPVGLGVKRAVQKPARGGQPVGLPNSRGKIFWLGESRTVVPLLTNGASAPWCPSHAVIGILHTKSSKTVKFGGCSPPLIWKIGSGGSGTPSVTHQWCAACSGILPVHVQAFCRLYQGFTTCAVCSGCFSYQGPVVGPRQCVAVGVSPTMGIALRWVGVLPRPCSGGGGWVGGGNCTITALNGVP